MSNVTTKTRLIGSTALLAAVGLTFALGTAPQNASSMVSCSLSAATRPRAKCCAGGSPAA